MSKYFVVKASNGNISIPVLNEAPTKPYIPIKGKGYIPLTTETNTTGLKVKGNNGKKYRAKAITTTQMSSTYIGNYTSTKGYSSTIKKSIGSQYFTTTQVTNSEYTEKTITFRGGVDLGISQTVSFTKQNFFAGTFTMTAFGNQANHYMYAGAMVRNTGYDASGYPKYETLKSYQYMTLTLTYTSFISVNNFDTEPCVTTYTVKFTHHPTISGSNSSKWYYSSNPVFEDFTYTIKTDNDVSFYYTGTAAISAELGGAYISTNKTTSTETLGCEGYTFTSSFTHGTYTGTFGAGCPYANTKSTTIGINKQQRIQVPSFDNSGTMIGDICNWMLWLYRSASKTSNRGITTYVISDYECTSYWTETTIV